MRVTCLKKKMDSISSGTKHKMVSKKEWVTKVKWFSKKDFEEKSNLFFHCLCHLYCITIFFYYSFICDLYVLMGNKVYSIAFVLVTKSFYSTAENPFYSTLKLFYWSHNSLRNTV